MSGIFDQAKKLIADNDEKIDAAAQKAGDFVDDKTKGKYSDKIDKAVDTIQKKTGTGDTTTDPAHHGATVDGDTTAP